VVVVVGGVVGAGAGAGAGVGVDVETAAARGFFRCFVSEFMASS